MQIKQFIVLCLYAAICLLFGNCKPTSGSEVNAAGNSPAETVPPRHFLQKNLPHAYKYVEHAPAVLQNLLANYAYRVLGADSLITSEKELENLFLQRENEVIPQLEEQVFDPLLNEDPDVLQNEESNYLFNELKEIGIKGIFAEGMYVALGEAPMLEAKLQALAAEPLRLKIEFEQAQTDAIGGEYPFLDLDGEIKSVVLGEQLLFQYPKTAYAKQVESSFRFCLQTLTDVHALSGKYDRGYLTHALSFEHYPYETDIAQIKQFAQKYPQSRYAGAISKIAENPSEMELDADAPLPVYLVVINRFKPETPAGNALQCANAEKEMYRYLDKGIDVCHTLLIYHKNEPTCALTYRYYPTPEKAGKALQTWATTMPGVPAEIVKIAYNSNLETWEIQSE
ncbi:hypothetical protein C7N43_24055 [Sphingobacteriales bacterium UPWRP_1]|nr:hypothetical protein BVG80_12820 [Sphingobacteriales bacterium TSM_CSM]PSJ74428.1 hypothetical protein C7N43_24055 [Sphingobacteriales bacterium UPWRP_1]